MDDNLPRPSLPLVITAEVLLGSLFVVGIGAVALLPGFSAGVASSFPEYADLRVPLLALATALIILGLVALAMVALLVGGIYRGTVLTRTSLLWVDVIVAVLCCAVVLIVMGFVTISKGQAGSPFLALAHAVAVLTLAALVCILLVLRSLLRHAILMRTELDEVI